MLNIVIDKGSNTDFASQLCAALEAEIRQGRLGVGARLPALVPLAKQLGLSHAAVRKAYEQLARMGLVSSHVGRGTFVLAPPGGGDSPPSPPPGPATAPASCPNLEAVLALANRPGLIRFTWGYGPEDALREGVLEELTRKALSARPQSHYSGYGPPAGLGELRDLIAQRLSQRGVKVSPDQVLITSGSQQALTLLASAAREAAWKVLIETPCYLGIAKAFTRMGAAVQPVERDDQGPRLIELDSAGAPQAMLYLCPELHNPTGLDLSPLRRKALLEWACRTHSLLVSDEIFHDLRFDNMQIDSLLADAGGDRAIVLGSLSKSFMPGLRIGWLVTSAARVRELTAVKSALDLGCPPLMQAIAVEALKGGEYDDHIRRVRRLYHIRRDAAVRALAEQMPPEVKWTRPSGGFHLWLELPGGCSSLALLTSAVQRGVSFVPGPLHDMRHGHDNCLRLSYGCVRPEEIARGVALLGEAVKDMIRQGPGGWALSGLGAFV